MDKKGNPMLSRRALFKEGAGFLGKMAGEFLAATNEIKKEFDEAVLENPLDPKRGFLRPPGAVTEELFVSLCTKCDDCIKACSQGTLFRAGNKDGVIEGTPIFDPNEKPCFICDDLSCIKACDEGALEIVPDIRTLAMGKARIDPSRCKAVDGEECDYCITSCPLSGEAIMELGGIPHIISANCVGCGLCQYNCRLNTGRYAIATLAPVL